mgnify:CR=1 FL=1
MQLLPAVTRMAGARLSGTRRDGAGPGPLRRTTPWRSRTPRRPQCVDARVARPAVWSPGTESVSGAAGQGKAEGHGPMSHRALVTSLAVLLAWTPVRSGWSPGVSARGGAPAGGHPRGAPRHPPSTRLRGPRGAVAPLCAWRLRSSCSSRSRAPPPRAGGIRSRRSDSAALGGALGNLWDRLSPRGSWTSSRSGAGRLQRGRRRDHAGRSCLALWFRAELATFRCRNDRSQEHRLRDRALAVWAIRSIRVFFHLDLRSGHGSRVTRVPGLARPSTRRLLARMPRPTHRSIPRRPR